LVFNLSNNLGNLLLAQNQVPSPESIVYWYRVENQGAHAALAGWELGSSTR
jgi:hypothetical protein